MGACQEYFTNWTSCSDIVHFACQLPTTQRSAFLLMFSALCWTIWKHRNEVCFKSGTLKTPRNIILLIISLIHYWTGRVKHQVKEATSEWMPETLEIIPLRIWDPADTQLVVHQGGDGAP